MPKYTDQQRESSIRTRLGKIMESPRPDYPEPRKPGRITMELNGKTTIVDLNPCDINITQWEVFINGKLFSGKCGMNQVYRELARLNPPARNFT